MNEYETRVVFEWTVPNESLSIEIINPNNQSIHFPLEIIQHNYLRFKNFFLMEKLKLENES